jgi:hypothetical protein
MLLTPYLVERFGRQEHASSHDVDSGLRAQARHEGRVGPVQTLFNMSCLRPVHQARLIWHLYYILHSSTATVQHPPGRLGMATVQHPPQQLCGSLD